jgi:hypothetical protein
MGAVLSYIRSQQEFYSTNDQWRCPKCSSKNPVSIYPTCHVCRQRSPNIVVPFSKTSLKPAWHCASCTYENDAGHRFCNACGRAKHVSVCDPLEKDN